MKRDQNDLGWQNVSLSQIKQLAPLIKLAEEAEEAERLIKSSYIIVNGCKTINDHEKLLVLPSGNWIWDASFPEGEFSISIKKEEIFSWFKEVWAFKEGLLKPEEEEDKKLMALILKAVKAFKIFVLATMIG